MGREQAVDRVRAETVLALLIMWLKTDQAITVSPLVLKFTAACSVSMWRQLNFEPMSGRVVEREDVQKQVMGPVFPFYLGPACFDVFSPQTLPGKVVQVTVRERE